MNSDYYENDTYAWELCVYSISRGQMVLTGCISKSGCFSDNHCKAVCTGVNGGYTDVYDEDYDDEAFATLNN